MSKKMPIKLFVKELEAAKKRKDGYIMGSKGQNPRTGYMDLSVTDVKSSWKENGWYYTQYSGNQRTQALKWRKECTRVWDCNGMAEGIYELFSGENIDSKARYNYAQWCDPKGSGMIPTKYRVPGAAVFWSGSGASSIHHVAYLLKPVKSGEPDGDWYIIEAKGVMYGVVMSKLYSRKPNYWGLMTKYFDYSDTDAGDFSAPSELHLGDRQLTNGCEGNDVKELQTNLIRLGYSCGSWGADGDFGDCTELAVRKFQKANKISVTGAFDKADLEVMNRLLAEEGKPVEETPKYVVISGGNCYIRTEPTTGEAGEKLGVAKNGTQYEFSGAISEDGWLKIRYKDRDAWVSGKYGKLVK